MSSNIGKSELSASHVLLKCVFLTATATLAAASGSLRLIGGQDAHENQLPYVVRLERNISIVMKKKTLNIYAHTCTCSVLTPQWTLTARHCIDDRKLEAISTIRINKYFVRYGATKGLENSQISDVIQFVRFTDRTKKLDDDIGLVKTMPITISQYGRLSSLHYFALMYQEVTATGFGVTNYTDTDDNPQHVMLTDTRNANRVLQIVKGMVISCRTDVYPSLCVSQSCTRPATACHGDSGGPVIHRSGIVAIHSDADVSNNCKVKANTFRTPITSVAIPISPYLDWLTKIILSDKTR